VADIGIGGGWFYIQTGREAGKLMSMLLEILGKGIEVDVADVIWHWLKETSPAGRQGDHKADPIDKITELVAYKKVESAQEQLRLYLFENSGCVRGRMAVAAIYLCENKLENTIEELNSIYMRQPSNTMALYTMGYCYERLLKQAQAVEFYQDCLKFKNYLRLPRQRLAAIYFKDSQIEKAITEYELLKAEYPDDITTMVILGHLYLMQGQYDIAVNTFNAAILMHPDNFSNTEPEIEQLICDGQHYDALEKIEDLLTSQPDRADLHLKKGDLLTSLGSSAEALAQYEEALHICPDFLEATIKLGTQYSQTERDEDAARQFNRAVEINDQIVEAYIGLALAYKLQGHTNQAISTLSLAAAIQPNSSILFAQTAILRFKANLVGNSAYADTITIEQDQLIEAVIAAHKQQIQSNPENPDLYYRLGILMMSVNRTSEAQKLFAQALEINPTFGRARTKLTICLYETGQTQPALEQLIAADRVDKNMLELHYKTALLYCDRIKFASSLLNLNHIMAANFTSADSTVNISIILQNLGLLDRVSAMWENLSETADQAAGTDPNTPNHEIS